MSLAFTVHACGGCVHKDYTLCMAQECQCTDYCDRCSAVFTMDVQCDEGFRAVTSRDLVSDQADFIPVCWWPVAKVEK